MFMVRRTTNDKIFRQILSHKLYMHIKYKSNRAFILDIFTIHIHIHIPYYYTIVFVLSIGGHSILFCNTIF